jgi:outer membrane protein assembly factor BamB
MIDFFGLAFDASGNLYAPTGSGGTILKFDPTGQESVFASGLSFAGNCAFDSSGNLYATSSGDGTVLKFDSTGQESVFASGLYAPLGIAVAVVPEPTSPALFGLGLISLRFLRLRRR